MKKTFAIAGSLFILANVAGCILPYYAYPKLSVTPALDLESSQAEDVHAFRIDRSAGLYDPTFGVVLKSFVISEKVTEIPLDKAYHIAAQIKPSLSYGIVVLGIALNFVSEENHTLLVRLYRPGFELIELQSWKPSHPIIWKPALTIDAQELALNQLFPTEGLYHYASPDEKRTAQYIASEFERLAVLTGDESQKKRLLDRATAIREWLSKYGTNPAPNEPVK